MSVKRSMVVIGSAICLLCFSAYAEILLQEGFESFPAFGKTTLAGWDGPAAPGGMYVTNALAATGTKSLQLDYLPGNNEGSTYMSRHFSRPVEDVYVQWNQRWSGNYVFGKICNKLIKIYQDPDVLDNGGGEFIPETSWGSNQLIVGGLIMKEAKQANGSWENVSYGQNVGTPVGFERDRWYNIEVHVKWNTPGQKDGLVEAWIDGVKKIYHTGREFRGSGPGDCNQRGCKSYLSRFTKLMVTGNRCMTDGNTVTENSWFDEIVVSTSRIGYKGVTTDVLAVFTQSLPPANTGKAYSVSLQALGGAAPYEWSVASGSLPWGLVLSNTGVLSGTPTNPGPFSFSVKVTDAGAPRAEATQSFRIIVSGTATGIIRNAMSESGITLLARPSGERVNFKLGFPQAGRYSIEIFDTRGRKVWKSTGTAESPIADLVWNHGGNLKRGVYLIRARQNARTLNARYFNGD